MSPHGRIVVGVSESLPGLQALRFAVAEARRRGLPLHAVRVWVIPPPTRTDAGYVWRDDLAAETRRCIDTALKQQVTDVDLLVLGAPSSRWHHSRIVRGCTRDTRCPVIVVPPPELARAVRWTSLRRLVREVIEGR